MIKYVRNQNTIASKLDDELVMTDLELDKHFSMNPVASRIWEIIETPKSIDEICDKIMEEFEIDQSICENDVNCFIKELISLKIATESK